MTFAVDEKTEVLGVWFAGGPRFDWLATMVIKDGNIEGDYRVRHHVDDKIHDSDDVKNWYRLGPIKDTPENRAHVKESMEEIMKMAPTFGCHQFGRFHGGTGSEFIEWIKRQPWAHIQQVPPKEKCN